MAALKRIEVTGGFLNGLDLEFVPGLNVIIGPRGAGKTSVLELLRYALGVRAITSEANKRVQGHAQGVLDGGSVSVTMANDGREVTLRRDTHSIADAAGELTRALQPLIVSQREIEEIGLDAGSRMHILDGLVGDHDRAAELELLEKIATVAEALDSMYESVDRGATRMLELAGLAQELATAEREAASQSAISAQLESEQARLRELSVELSELSQDAAANQELLESLDATRQQIAQTKAQMQDLAKFDEANPTRERVTGVAGMLGDAHTEVGEAVETLARLHGEQASKIGTVRHELRDQSERLETLQAGAGDLARRLTRLREQQAERQQIGERLASLETEIADAMRRRSALLDQLEAFRDERFARRRKGARDIAAMFDNEIEVRLSRNGHCDEFETALAKALEGSGLHYRGLARQLAPRITPRTLVEAVEQRDAGHIIEVGEITRDRAERLIAHLRSTGTARVLTTPLDDAVDYALLDGDDYKPTAALSTGQRCTVILPLLLAHDSQLTVLDQPEDHLDNACIVDTVVRAVLARKAKGSLVIATHNANIPVLGAAEQVIVLRSDGRRGVVERAGSLDDLQVIRSVTSIMEGGEEAFRKRADFYASHNGGAPSANGSHAPELALIVGADLNGHAGESQGTSA